MTIKYYNCLSSLSLKVQSCTKLEVVLREEMTQSNLGYCTTGTKQL